MEELKYALIESERGKYRRRWIAIPLKEAQMPVVVQAPRVTHRKLLFRASYNQP
jgi:hypothetical protein